MITFLLILCVALDVACLILLVKAYRIRKETHDLLTVIRAWVDHGKDIREDTRQQSERAERKTDQLTTLVQTRLPEVTANKVVEKIAGGSVDSGALPVIKDNKESS